MTGVKPKKPGLVELLASIKKDSETPVRDVPKSSGKTLVEAIAKLNQQKQQVEPSSDNSTKSTSIELSKRTTSLSNLESPTLVYELRTYQMLKMLSKIMPTTEWSSDWLTANVRKPGFYSFPQGITLTYKGQPDGSGTQHLWEIRVDASWAEKLTNAYKQISGEMGLVLPKKSVSNNSRSDYYHSENGLNFRSQAEFEIAKALEKRRVLFFVNAKCRIRNRINCIETKETDFLVFYKGSPRILEVDGWEFHQRPSEDYQRDRLFDREGIKSTRFSATECLNNADEVVDEFLELFGAS